jgi:hypothetical protein
MGHITKVNGSMTNNMVRVLRAGRTAPDMMGNTSRERRKEKAD